MSRIADGIQTGQSWSAGVKCLRVLDGALGANPFDEAASRL
jgi:hypothetical protein